MFIERQSHRSSEKDTELSWSYQEARIATNDYHGQQQKSYYQPPKYNERQQYWRSITAQNVSLYNAFEKEKVDHQGSFHSVKETPSRKHVTVIPCVPEQEHHKKTISLLRNFYDIRKKQGA